MSRFIANKLALALSCFCLSAFMYVMKHRMDPLIEVTEKEVDLAQKVRERRNMFLMFVGGMPRSGTTLMRTMLDAHPDIRCGLETFVIQEILNSQHGWSKDARLVAQLSDAGVYPVALDNAIAQFILEIILGHGPPTTYYCNKDPYTLGYTAYLHKLFPQSKFIMMIRDGRAFAHSVVSRGVAIRGFNIKDYRDVISKWSIQIQEMYSKCLDAGNDVCLPIKYEQLVLQPVDTTKKVFKFLEIPWDSRVLHHEDFLNETDLSELEYSTSQVSRPINLDALYSWFGKIPKDVERDMSAIAPMLDLLGYDSANKKPNYGQPDDFVIQKLKKTEKEEKKKKVTTLK